MTPATVKDRSSMIAGIAGLVLAVILFGFTPLSLSLWVTALHVVAVIAWMAGMLYLPRLFVYHSETPKGSIQSETFKIMERRLLKAIINPAMIVTWVLGLYLVWDGGWYTSGWPRVCRGGAATTSPPRTTRIPAPSQPYTGLAT